MRAKTLILAVAIVLPLFAPALAVDKTWNGAVSDKWADPSNWSPAGVPESADDVTHGSVDPGNDPGAPIIMDHDLAGYTIK